MVVVPEITRRLVVAVDEFLSNPLGTAHLVTGAEKEFRVAVKCAVRVPSVQVGNKRHTRILDAVFFISRQAVGPV